MTRMKRTVFVWTAAVIAVLMLAAAQPAQAQADAQPAADPAKAAAVLEAIGAIKAHITGETKLNAEAIADHTKTINQNKKQFGLNTELLEAGLDLVSTYDKAMGPLFIGRKALDGKNRKPEDEMHWAVFWVMQDLIDEVYTTAGMKQFGDLLAGRKFGTADYFPGKVEQPIMTKPHKVKIMSGYPDAWGPPVFQEDRPARKPTGTYLVPGTIATVTVPRSMVGKGYQVRVGAHSWDLTKKPRVNRLYRVSTVYDIDSTKVKVANPLGGGIYIEVPFKADGDVVEVTVEGAARSPYFSWKSFDKTSLEQWRDTERHFKSPWADFQSEKFMCQVPTSWIYKLDDPVTLMKDWDKSIDVINDLMGYPRDMGRETIYTQVDTQLRGRAFHPGYPGGNRGYDPTKDYGGDHNNHLVKGPQFAHSYEFHEQGHAYLFPKYAGGRESAVNLLHVAMLNQGFGVDLDEAFRSSRSVGNTFATVDTAAIAWMMSDSFVDTGIMKNYERAYQLKGHAKYVDVARLFGWETLGKFFKSMNQDFMDGNPWKRDNGGEDGDRYTLRLSESAGADLRPLIHFWGIPIVNKQKSDEAFKAAGLKPSAKVYDTLVKYQKLIPADNKAFRVFAKQWWNGKEPSKDGFTTQRNHAARWKSYDKDAAQKVRDTVQKIIDLYFPDGRPE